MTPRRALRTGAFVAATGLAAVACGGSDAADDSASTPVGTEAAPADEPADGDESGDSTDAAQVPGLLQFTAPLVGGGELDAAELADKPTAFWFWSPT